jgi:large subunit ribosomal protein L25
MANELILMAEPREVHGKKVKALRREGLIPGVVYGPVVDGTVSVSVNSREFNKFFMTNGHSTIFTIKWDGGSQPVLIREVQRDPVRQDILHIDFFAPNMTVTLRQNVAVQLIHAADVQGGMLQQALNEIEVEALPANLPSEIQVDVSHLTEIGNTIHVSEIPAIENVTFVTDETSVIASIVAEAVQEEPAEGEEAEVAEGEEAAEAAESEGDDEDGGEE